MKYRPDSAEHAATAAICLLLAFVLVLLALAFAPHADGSTPDPQVARLRREVVRQHARGDAYRLKYLSKKRWWTARDIEFAAHHTADQSGLKGALKWWAVEACIRTAKREAAKDDSKGYLRYDTHSVKPNRSGLHQWGDHWAGTDEQKQNGVWSCRRFMQVVVDGGNAKVRQHWEQTIGAL